jgi:hypothetical protein
MYVFVCVYVVVSAKGEECVRVCVGPLVINARPVHAGNAPSKCENCVYLCTMYKGVIGSGMRTR